MKLLVEALIKVKSFFKLEDFIFPVYFEYLERGLAAGFINATDSLNDIGLPLFTLKCLHNLDSRTRPSVIFL